MLFLHFSGAHLRLHTNSMLIFMSRVSSLTSASFRRARQFFLLFAVIATQYHREYLFILTVLSRSAYRHNFGHMRSYQITITLSFRAFQYYRYLFGFFQFTFISISFLSALTFFCVATATRRKRRLMLRLIYRMHSQAAVVFAMALSGY